MPLQYRGRTETLKRRFLIEHYAKYDTPPYPPAWKTLEVSSFGTLSKLYCNLSDNNLKKQIARELGLPQHLYLESWIKSLSVLRNCIAHHARIWNRNIHGNHNYLRNYKTLGFKIRLYHRKSYMLNYVV